MISADGKEIKHVVERERCPHITIPFTRQITPLRDLWCLLLLIKIVFKEKPDIVHTHTPKAGLIGMLASYICRVPIRLHTIAGLPLMVATGFKRSLLESIEKLTYRCATKILPNSKSIKSFILDHAFTSEKKLHIIGEGSSNGIDLKKYTPDVLDDSKINLLKKDLLFDENNFYFLAVGRIVRDKGIEELVNTFKKINLEYSNTRLVLLGTFEKELDPISSEIELEVKENLNIHFIGWSDHVEYYMSFCNALIHASYREGFPNVLLQAGAMNCPIVCSDIPGNIDIVDDMQTGLLFKVKDRDHLYEKMVWLINNPSEIESFTMKLSNKIYTFFERTKFHNLLKDFYNNQFN